MGGDLTTHLLFEAGASGLLCQLNPDPYNPFYVLQLSHLLDRLLADKAKRVTQIQLAVHLVTQLCMAVAKPDEYEKFRDYTHERKQEFIDLEYPHNKKIHTKKSTPDAYYQLIKKWQDRFGDPDEAVRRQEEWEAARKQKHKPDEQEQQKKTAVRKIISKMR